MRKQQIALFTNPNGSTGYLPLGTETPEQCTTRLKSEGKKEILLESALKDASPRQTASFYRSEVSKTRLVLSSYSSCVSSLSFQRLFSHVFSADRLAFSRRLFRKQCFSKRSNYHFNLGRGIGFFINHHQEGKREKRTKILDHYCKLREHVLEKWLSASGEPIRGISYVEGLSPASKDYYLNSSLIFKGESRWHKWTMQHIRDEKGYPEIQVLFKELETYEKNHNDLVSSVLKTIKNEAELSLRTFPNLKKHASGMSDDFYNEENVLYALHNPDEPLKVFDLKELYAGSSRRTARSDNQTIPKLKDEIERIRSIHEKDFEKIEEGKREDERILDKINSLIDGIIYDLSLEKPLKGKCDYERSLDK